MLAMLQEEARADVRSWYGRWGDKYKKNVAVGEVDARPAKRHAVAVGRPRCSFIGPAIEEQKQQGERQDEDAMASEGGGRWNRSKRSDERGEWG